MPADSAARQPRGEQRFGVGMGKGLKYDFVVLGGGLAGLALADEVGRRGYTALVLEKQAVVGGLAQTVVHGDFRFDLGGHRFHTHDLSLTLWLRTLLGDRLVPVVRRSRIRLGSRSVDYPLQLPNALTAFSPAQAVRLFASYVRAAVSPRRSPDVTFEDWVVHRFGQALYEVYFRPYTEKVWGVDCKHLSAEWANQRIKVPSLGRALGATLGLGRQTGFPVTHFAYPRLGIGEMAQAIAARAVERGLATVETGTQPRTLKRVEGRPRWEVAYEHEGHSRVVEGGCIVSTIPLHELHALLGWEPPCAGGVLAYRDLICIFLALQTERISPDTWTYLPDRRVLFGRIHEPRNWSVEMAPEGSTSLCAEVFCTRGDAVWARDDGWLVDRTVADLARLGLVQPSQVSRAWVRRVTDAYPVYGLGYERALASVNDRVAAEPGLHLLGRTGSFRYLNMDAVLLQAFSLAERIAPPSGGPNNLTLDAVEDEARALP